MSKNVHLLDIHKLIKQISNIVNGLNEKSNKKPLEETRNDETDINNSNTQLSI